MRRGEESSARDRGGVDYEGSARIGVRFSPLPTFFASGSMADNPRSRLITHGVARSPNRSMLRAVGFGDGDFDKPIIGVANGHSTMNPCNPGIQPLADRAIEALRKAGAMPQVFGFPTITDGIGMGTEAM